MLRLHDSPMQRLRYGLLGQGIGYSRSPELFHEIWGDTADDYSFELIDTEEVDAFISEVRTNALWGGFTVTTPYKIEIIRHLDAGLTDTAERAGAVNVVRRSEDGRLRGHNSDVIGFEEMVRPLVHSHPQALILGSGGAARAVILALARHHLTYHTVSRTGGKADLTYVEIDSDLIRHHRLIINATPLGSAKHPGERPPIPYEALGADHFLIDLTYTPAVTPFLSCGMEHGAIARNGYSMLRHQAVEAWRFLNSQD